MPHMDGFEVMQAIRPLLAAERYLPVLIVTADDSPTVKQRALAMGARDFLAKPFDSVEALLRIRNLLVTRQLYAQLEREQQQLEQAVFDRTEALHSTHLEIVERLARAAEYRDDNTGEHTRRVGRLAGLLARTLGLSEIDAKTIERAAALHDVGKVGVPDAILLKPGSGSSRPSSTSSRPTRSWVRGSCRAAACRCCGWRRRLPSPTTSAGMDAAIRTAAIGEGIPLAGRVVALADAFDAMTHDRPYQRGILLEQALEVVRSERARHFDPQVVDAFIELFGSYLDSLAPPSDERAQARG